MGSTIRRTAADQLLGAPVETAACRFPTGPDRPQPVEPDEHAQHGETGIGQQLIGERHVLPDQENEADHESRQGRARRGRSPAPGSSVHTENPPQSQPVPELDIVDDRHQVIGSSVRRF